MANNQRFSITFDASLNVSQMKGALNDIQKSLNNLHLPQNATKGLQGTFSKLSEEIQKFEVAAGKEIGSKADFSKLEKSASKIGDLFGTLKRQVSELTGLKGKALEKLFPENVSKNITNASKALDNYKTAFKNVQNDINKATSSVEKFNKSLERERGKKVVTNEAFKKIEQDSKQAQIDVDNLTQKLQTLQQEHKTLGSTLSSPNKSSVYRKQTEDIKGLITELEKAKQKATALSEQKANTTTFDKQAKKVAELTANLTDAQTKLSQFQQVFNQLQNPQSGDLSKLIEQVGRLTGLDMSKFKANAEGVGQAIETYIVQEAEKMSQGLNKMGASVDNAGTHVQDLGRKMQEAGREMADVDARMREVDALKSRIQYFFGLNNTIELVKRTIRSAFETVKDLDKAMTETAVVTDFSVADMWAQLPDYTKRANDLGVTTKAAYEAATLYYQQGLKTNEVTAMSNETLKMARIAGLDAAVATDRMTNAIRGFNMEINEMNAQRIDDVYSKLAAISASNVDEISTAMTKVASLANNANMEFETTSAFLAQIIETTRESAETAGTALKTVVARFSEVKKLVSEGQLQGSDEEGEGIDVNKVQAALRTAGVDLRRYFLGEVGLDDIFMELASKWDSLTTLQQRYIATQAAGSRQQSRFIALMSDYGRMQELVGEAYNANGAAAEQFAKTQESLESKLARLKNAWNEFAMGIANSDLVKAGVDFLTLLLNGVNKLTDGFGLLTGSVGGFISSILKLGLLIGGLNVGKSLIGGGIGGLGGLFKGAETGGFKQGFLGALGANTGKDALSKIFGGFAAPINGAKAIGKNLWGLSKQFGGTLISSSGLVGKGAGLLSGIAGGGELGMGLAGVGGVAGIGLAAAGAYVAVKKLYDLSPAGQLKAAEKYAADLRETADAAKEASRAYEDIQSKYKDFGEGISKSKTNEERSTAIQSRNDYLLSLIKEDATYAKYISSAINNGGEIVLTLDEKAFAKAVEEKGTAATKAERDSYFAEADAELKRAFKLDQEAYNDASYLFGGLNDDSAERIERQAAVNAAKQAAAVQARLGYQNFFQSAKYDSELANTFATALSKVYEKTGRIDETSLRTINGLVNSKPEQIKKIAQALSGESTLNTNLLGLKSDEDFLSVLGLDKDSQELSDFATVLGITTDELKRFAINAAKANQETQRNNRERLQKTFDKYKVPQGYRQDYDATSTPEIDGLVADIYDSIDGKVKSGQYNSLLEPLLDPEATVEELQDLQLFIDSINLDDPITAFNQLQDAIKGNNWRIAEFGKAILNSNQDILNTGNLVKSSLISDYDEDMTKAINKILKKNGRIGVEDLSELTSGSENLSKLLESGIINGRTLAKVLTLIGKGRIGFDDVNTSLLSVIDNTYTLRDVAEDVHSFIANFDEGLDFGEGVDFAQEKLKELQELINNFEYGNERTSKLWNAFFGEDYESAWARGEDYIKTHVQQLSKWVENDAYGFFSDANIMSALGITNQGGGQLDWDLSSFKNVDDLIAKIERAGQVSREGAQILLESFAAHSDQAWNKQFEDLSFQGALDNIIQQYEQGKTFWSQDEIEAIANSYGVSVEELKERLQEKNNEAFSNFTIFGPENVLTGGDLFARFQEQLSLNGQSFESFITQFIENGQLQIERLKNALHQMGLDDYEINDLMSTFEKNFPEVKIDGEVNDVEVTEQFMQSLGNATNQAITNDTDGVLLHGPKINLEDNAEVKKQLEQYSEGGAVDLTLRPVIPTKLLNDAGYKAGEGIATTFTETFANKSGDLAMNFTPIMTDENGNYVGVLDPESFAKYAQEVVDGVREDDLHLQIGAEFTGLNATAKAADTAQYIHELQEAFYLPGKALLQGIQENDPKARAVLKQMADAASTEIYNGISQGTINASEVGAMSFGAELNSAVGRVDFYSSLYNKLKAAGSSAAGEIRRLLQQAIANLKANINVTVNNSNTPSYGGRAPSLYQQEATYAPKASGGHISNPLNALTGEEDPEIVWNKQKGYAYITGQGGPEFRRLQAGDQVFNASQTKDILRRSKKNGFFASHAGGGARWNIGSSTSGSTKQSSGSSSSEKTSDEWKNELDWLYNLMEDIAESERTQEKLATKHERYLKDATKTGKDLYNITKQQMQNLNQQYAYQKQALAGREREMQEQINQSGYTNYIWWNNNDRTIEINWDKIEGIQNKDTYDKVSELVSKAEDIQSKIDTAEDALLDIEDQMKELQERYVQEYVDFEKRVLDAVVNKYQEQIDNLSELNDILNDSNTNILNSIREEVDLQRQIRDNTDTENQIKDMEARLAYLRRDTTGANQTEILQLEKQLEDARQGYSDTLVDQSIDRLSKDNDAAAEQRQHQIDLLTTQLDYWQKSGALWEEVHNLMKDGISPEGWIRFDSDLMAYLKNTEEFNSMSFTQQGQWIKELENVITEVNAYTLNRERPLWDNSTDYKQIMKDLLNQRGVQALLEPAYQEAAAARIEKVVATKQGTREMALREQQELETSILGYSSLDIDPEALTAFKELLFAISTKLITDAGKNLGTTNKYKFATGGLTSKTGLAWLDGTTNEPEYVLNARQTEAFLHLSEVLPNMFSNTNSSTITNGNVYLEITMNVGEIGNDYDVDRLVDRVKQDIYDASTYRNVNIVTRNR